MMSDNTENIEQDYSRVVDEVGHTHFLPGTSIEIVRDPHLAGPPQHALFDFDGTLSLIREGWPDVMVPMMVEILRDTGTSESEEELHEISYRFVMELTGKQTIYQMIRLAEEVTKRGGQPMSPSQYKHVYHERLMVRIQSRHDNLRTGHVPAQDMLVPGSLCDGSPFQIGGTNHARSEPKPQPQCTLSTNARSFSRGDRLARRSVSHDAGGRHAACSPRFRCTEEMLGADNVH